MKCSNCGKDIADNSKFCEFCGAKINRLKESLILSKWLYFIATFLCTLANMALASIWCEFDGMRIREYTFAWQLVFMGIISLFAIVALIQTIRQRLHWHDCLIVWLFLTITVLGCGEFDIFSRWDIPVVYLFAFILTIYYLFVTLIVFIVNKIKNRRNKNKAL